MRGQISVSTLYHSQVTANNQTIGRDRASAGATHVSYMHGQIGNSHLTLKQLQHIEILVYHEAENLTRWGRPH